MIRAEGLTLTVGERVILAGIDFEVARGESVALVGPNGSGKTSVLRCLLGLAPFAGRATIDGRECCGNAGRTDHCAHNQVARLRDVLDQQPRRVRSAQDFNGRPAKASSLRWLGNRHMLHAETLSLFAQRLAARARGQTDDLEVHLPGVAQVLDHGQRVDPDRPGGTEHDQSSRGLQ